MRPRIMPVLVLALALVVFAGAAAFAAVLPEAPYDETVDCYACHSGGGLEGIAEPDFSSAGPVNYEKCYPCHSFGELGLGHYHLGQPITNCALCHNGSAVWTLSLPEDATARQYPATKTPYGYFASAASLGTPPDEIHRLHGGMGWVETEWSDEIWICRTGVKDGTSNCSPCHAPSACSVCHDAPPQAHADHAVSEYPAITVKQATGSTSVTYEPSTCMNTDCHDYTSAATGGFVPTCASCHPQSPDETHGESHTVLDSLIDGTACSVCHSLDMIDEHERPTSSSAGLECAACHPSPVASVKPWNGSCATGACHTGGSAAPMHEGMDSAHLAIPSSSGCPNCHAMDLKTEHAARSVGCDACHGDPEYAVLFGSGWDGTCDACHLARHKDRTRSPGPGGCR